MKPTSIFHPLLASTVVVAWSIPRDGEEIYDLINDMANLPHCLKESWPLSKFITTPRSTIPGFILDTNHLWITKYFTHLRNHPNIAAALCSLHPSRLSLSRNPKIPPIPIDLFHTLNINNPSKVLLSWKPLMDSLAEIMNCPAALQHLQSLNVDLFFRGHMHRLVPPQGESVGGLFGQLFTRTPNLMNLAWDGPCEVADAFEQAFEKSNLTLPSVKHLAVGAYSDYLVRMTPNLESLEIRDSRWHCGDYHREGPGPVELLVMAVEGVNKERGGNNIKRVSVVPDWGVNSTGLLIGILNAMPNITSIALHGELERKYNSHWWKELGVTLKSFLRLLAGFPNLTSLHLPKASKLSLGHQDRDFYCGYALVNGGKQLAQEILAKEAKTIETATRLTLKALPNLRELSIGKRNTYINLTDVDSDGIPSVRWPWTDRLEKWTRENAWGMD